VSAAPPEPEDWREAMLARLRDLPLTRGAHGTVARALELPRHPGEPDNPAAAGQRGWAYVRGYYEPAKPVPRDPAAVVASDPGIAETLRSDQALALALMGVDPSHWALAGLHVRPAPRVISVIAKTEYTFDARINALEMVPLAESLDATDFSAGVLVVRLHESTTWTAVAANAVVEVYNMSRRPDDPGVLFAEDTPIASITIPIGIVAPALYVDALTAPIADELRVVLVWNQGIRESTAGDRVVIAVDLLGRP
jgi:hypothetical protein